MIGIYRGIVVEALTTVWAPKSNLWVVQSGTQGPFAEASRIPGDTREAIAGFLASPKLVPLPINRSKHLTRARSYVST